MGKTVTSRLRIDGALRDFVSMKIGDCGTYPNAGEYVRDLIRRDMERAQQAAFERLKAELTDAFHSPDSTYKALTADEVIARNRRV